LGDYPTPVIQEFIEGSVIVRLVSVGDPKPVDPDDYVITKTDDGFTFRFADPDYELKGEQLEIFFTSSYDLGAPNSLGQYNNGSLIRLRNDVNAEADRLYTDLPRWTGGTQAHIDINIEQYRNAAKSGTYENGYFTWTINFNHVNTVPIGSAITIRDWWNPDDAINQQEILTDSFRVSVGGTQLSNSRFTITPRSDGRGFDLVLAGSVINNQPVSVVYQTRRIGESSPIYTNHVQLIEGPAGGTPIYSAPVITASTAPVPTELISKEGAAVSGNDINWTLTVNQALYDLRDVRIVDVLGGYGRISGKSAQTG
jgi:uncharacterized surface anchored protein